MLSQSSETLNRRILSAVSRAILLSGVAVGGLNAVAANAQTNPDSQAAPADDDDVILVEGIRATIQSSINTKREATEIVDALSAEDIGDLPALSIGEALETLTGAASHREQGGATEISIRGLGPFLGSTTINGRIASNGSGDRSVNFSQFPSELFNKAAIYKTQSASQIEGGVAGQIQLSSVKPIDFGKRQIQGEIKANYNPQNSDIAKDQRLRDLGYRGTISYIDQFKLGDGEVGIALGYQHNAATNPEQEARISDTLNYCANGAAEATANRGVFAQANCTGTRPDTLAQATTDNFVIARNSLTYRQNITNDNRDSFFGTLQLKPNSDVDIGFDFQFSDRVFTEHRNDLVFVDGRRIDGLNDSNIGLPQFPLIRDEFGFISQFTNETGIETNNEYVQRSERFYSGGLNIAVQATERLKLSADANYNETARRETATQVRLRIQNDRDINGNFNAFPTVRFSDATGTNDDRAEAAFQILQNGDGAFTTTLLNFDVTNTNLFQDSPRIRNSLSQDRFNSVFSARGDFEYTFDGFLSAVTGGVRYQDLKYQDQVGGINGATRNEVNFLTDTLSATTGLGTTAVRDASLACRTAFPESGFLSSVVSGPLITNVNSAGDVAASGTGNTFATFDALCLARAINANAIRNSNSSTVPALFDADGNPIYPEGGDAIGNTDVREKSWAGYLQANFDGDLGSLPVRGNLGLRVVRTEVVSNGFRGPLTATLNTNGDGTGVQVTAPSATATTLTAVSGGGSYTEFLPSFNLVADVAQNVQGRFAVYRSLSRPDPSALGYGRTFTTTTDDDATSLADFVGRARGTGNPFLEPLLSWNVDAAVEWYPNKDTILAGGFYYKRFNGGFEGVGQIETFDINGQDFDALVVTTQTTDKASTIYGFELTASHRLSFLPAPLDGLGFKVSYNWADSNFKFEDGQFGSVGAIDTTTGAVTFNEALIPAANLFGFSKHVLSAQVYYQLGPIDLQGVYKYRSRYFQQFVGDTANRVRYTDDSNVFEARISVKVTDNIRVTAEGINLFNEPRTDFRPTVGNLSQTLVYGPRYFFGVRAKF